jgi:hypothetical protein
MSRRNLSAEELRHVGGLAAEVRKRLTRLAAGDPRLLFVYCRQLVKQLPSEETGKTRPVSQVKASKWDQQEGKCARCGRRLSLLKYSKLSKMNDGNGYSVENTELIHNDCLMGK